MRVYAVVYSNSEDATEVYVVGTYFSEEQAKKRMKKEYLDCIEENKWALESKYCGIDYAEIVWHDISVYLQVQELCVERSPKENLEIEYQKR